MAGERLVCAVTGVKLMLQGLPLGTTVQVVTFSSTVDVLQEFIGLTEESLADLESKMAEQTLMRP